MKVLFLDVDGVLNSAEFFVSGKVKSVLEVDPKAVKRLNRIIEKTRCTVVLSSSWRKYPEWLEILRASGVCWDDVTPVLTDGHRGREIRTWLHGHPEVSKYAIIDDDPDAGAFDPLLYVRTYWRVGMYGKHERRLLEILG